MSQDFPLSLARTVPAQLVSNPPTREQILDLLGSSLSPVVPPGIVTPSVPPSPVSTMAAASAPQPVPQSGNLPMGPETVPYTSGFGRAIDEQLGPMTEAGRPMLADRARQAAIEEAASLEGVPRVTSGIRGTPMLTNVGAPQETPIDARARASRWLESRRASGITTGGSYTPRYTPSSEPIDMSTAAIAGRIRTASALNDLWGAESGLRLEEQKRRTEELAQERAQEEATITPEQAHRMRMQLERERHPEAKSVDALMFMGEQILRDPQTKERFAQRYGYEQQMKADPAWFTKLPKDAQDDVARVMQETDALLQLQRILVGANRGRLYEPKEDQDFLSAAGVPQGQPQQPR